MTAKKIEGELVIPDSVTTIEEYAFMSCDALTSVTIGNSVTTIGVGAFWGCDSLTSVFFENPTGWIDSSSGYTVDFSDSLYAAEKLKDSSWMCYTRA